MTMILTAEERAQQLLGGLLGYKAGSLQDTATPTTLEVYRLRKELQLERAARQEEQVQFETKWEAVRQGMNWLKEQLCNMNRQCCLQQAQFERMLQQERTMRQEVQAQSDFLGTGLQKQMKTANPMASFALSSHPARHSEHTSVGEL